MKRLIGLSVFVASLVFCTVSQASLARELTYSESTVWRCAVRFIRVDAGYKIVEKDKDSGYLLFEYTDSGRAYTGALEVLKLVRNDREYVRIQFNLVGQPKYMESLLFKKLERKLKNEYGIAPTAKYVGPPVKEAAGETTAAKGAKSADDEPTEEELRITEDDLNEAHQNE